MFQALDFSGFDTGLQDFSYDLSGLETTDFNSDPYGAIDSTLSSVGLGFVAEGVETVGKLFGMGPDDWADVEKKFKGYFVKFIGSLNYIKDIVNCRFSLKKTNVFFQKFNIFHQMTKLLIIKDKQAIC